MRKLLKYLKPYTKECIISPLFKLLEAIFDLLVPLVVKTIIDDGIAAGDKSVIGACFGILVAFAAVGLTCSLIAQYFAARAAVGVSTDLRRDLFAHIGKFSYAQTDSVGTSTLITRLTGDVNQVQSAVNFTLRLLLRSPIIVLGAAAMAFFVDVKGAWVFAVVIPVLAVIIFSIMLKTTPLYAKVQKNLDGVTGVVRENLLGVRVLRAFRKEEDEITRFSAANEEHNRVQNFAGRISALMNPLTLVVVNAGVIVLLASGAKLVQIGNMSQGDVVALTNYMAQILVELVKFAMTVFTVNKALASADRVQAIFDTPVGMETLDDDNTCGSPDEAVRFENVSLTYAGDAEETLSGIHFVAHRGETVGIIGSTGSGKTSLVNLIPRFYEATKGRVLVNGRDVRSLDVDALRESIAIVPQKAVLFSGTVRSNLLWGKADATEEEMWKALEWAQAKEFILQKNGLDEPVSAGGKNFSGGQRQRLTIARALIRGAEILILDDSSSALDYATDAALRAALHTLPNSPTVFIISQRTSSIRHADLILVMEDGRLVDQGRHDELLARCEVYREIHESQFKKGGEPT
ncbi:MAG: ABC transporter ATP-binding protein [Ruminococcaceae bacterium]|nr:ABC transporter ATP-binding protein [Oscillospiraceae bacterium]